MSAPQKATLTASTLEPDDLFRTIKVRGYRSPHDLENRTAPRTVLGQVLRVEISEGHVALTIGPVELPRTVYAQHGAEVTPAGQRKPSTHFGSSS